MAEKDFSVFDEVLDEQEGSRDFSVFEDAALKTRAPTLLNPKSPLNEVRYLAGQELEDPMDQVKTLGRAALQTALTPLDIGAGGVQSARNIADPIMDFFTTNLPQMLGFEGGRTSQEVRDLAGIGSPTTSSDILDPLLGQATPEQQEIANISQQVGAGAAIGGPLGAFIAPLFSAGVEKTQETIQESGLSDQTKGFLQKTIDTSLGFLPFMGRTGEAKINPKQAKNEQIAKAFENRKIKAPEFFANAQENPSLLDRTSLKGSRGQKVFNDALANITESVGISIEDLKSRLTEGGFDGLQISEDLSFDPNAREAAIRQRVNSIAPDLSDLEASTTIKEALTETQKSERARIRDLYQNLDQAISTVEFSDPFVKTTKVAKEMQGSIAKAKRLQTAASEATLNKLGTLIDSLSTDGGFRGIGVDEAIAMNRNLKEFVDFDIRESNVKNLVKPVIEALDKEIKGKLRAKSPALEDAFINAQNQYRIFAETFGQDSPSVWKALNESAPPENILQLNKASEFKGLQDALRFGENDPSVNLLTRKILEKIPDSSAGRELTRGLLEVIDTPENRIAIESIQDLTNPLSMENIRFQDVDTIRKRSLQSAYKGIPDTTNLKLMNSNKGRQLLKEALGNDLYKAYADEWLTTFSDRFVEQFTKNPKETANALQDKQIQSTLRDIGGQDLVNFYQDYQNISEGVSQAIEKYKLVNRENPSSQILTKLGLYKIGGLPLYLGSKVIEPVMQSKLGKIWSNKVARTKAKEISKIGKMKNISLPMQNKLKKEFEELQNLLDQELNLQSNEIDQ